LTAIEDQLAAEVQSKASEEVKVWTLEQQLAAAAQENVEQQSALQELLCVAQAKIENLEHT